MNWFKISSFLSKGYRDKFDVTSHEQKDFIISLGEIRSDIDRSYKQYCSQNFFIKNWKVRLLNFVSFFVFIPCLLFLTIKRFFIPVYDSTDALAFFKNEEFLVPKSLKGKYDITYVKINEGQSISIYDWPFVFKLFISYFAHSYFSLKCLMKIAFYSHVIEQYRPSVVITQSEYTFVSSALTCYCNKKGLKHINVMHGEKVFNICNAFFRFDECYVWSDYYIKLFCEMRCEPNQFIIAVPESFVIETNKYLNKEYFANYKYYLAIYNEEELISIVNSMAFAKKMGQTVKYRPHPIYSDISVLAKHVPSSEIEDPHEVNIMESISNLDYAVGSYSTVLTQAFHSGKRVILDDMTFFQKFERLKDLKYVMTTEKCPPLSSFQR